MAGQKRPLVGTLNFGCLHFRPESPEDLSDFRPESPEDLSAVTLVDIFENLVSYFNEIEKFRKFKKHAEEKCNITKEDDGCWSDDDIRRVWDKTQGMEKDSIIRNNWALVALLQLIERHREDLSGLIKGGNIVQRSEDRDELGSEYRDDSGGNRTTSDQFWPIYGVRQSRSGAEYLVFDQNTEDSPDAPSGHSWKRVEEESENKENRGTAGGDVQRKPERINSEDRSPQINADLETVGAAGADEEGFIYIRIPLAEMLHNEPTPTVLPEAQPVPSSYKLIDGSPSRTDLRIRRMISYGMSFNNLTKNANWVYEILNKETLAENPVQRVKFEAPYSRGHLAAAGNHRWCQEARNDADLNSNIAPQHVILNSVHWNRLEEKCRRHAKELEISNVHVYSGPLYRRDICPPMSGKTVPSHFFKVIIVENDKGSVENLECYLMPNDQIADTDLPRTVLALIQYIERASGLTFIEHRPNVREERIITVSLRGEGVNEITHDANIRARICQNNNDNDIMII